MYFTNKFRNVLNAPRVVLFRLSTDASLAAVSRTVQQVFLREGFCDFQSRWAFIVTWHNVSYYISSATYYFVCTRYLTPMIIFSIIIIIIVIILLNPTPLNHHNISTVTHILSQTFTGILSSLVKNYLY